MASKKSLGLNNIFKRAKKWTYDDLLNAESAVGRTLFGPVPVGHQREFFALRRNTWMWYENWFDERGEVQEISLRYEVHPDGVYKKPLGGVYAKISGAELDNFVTAARMYHERVKQELYSK